MSGGDMVWLPWAGLGAGLALFGAWRATRRGDIPAVLRRGGYAVGILGLWALGVPSLLWRLWAALSGWAGRLLLSPLSWVGALATVAAAALVFTGVAWGARRGSGRALTIRRSRSRKQPDAVQPSAASPQSGEDHEIEAILRRHGIS